MDFTETWHWPQWTWLILAFLTLLAHAANHGNERPAYNFPVALLNLALVLFLLIAGGFFS